MNISNERHVKIGKHCVIEDDVYIGDGTEVKNFVEIRNGVKIGEDCYIDSGVCFTGDAQIGDRVVIRNNCVIARGSYIGDDTFIAPQVMFQNLNTQKVKIGGAIIGKNCFIGTNVTLKEGIIICDNVTIGSKSYVNEDIREPGVYVGCPAEKL